MLDINLIYDAQALAAPQSFRDGMEAAALMLERHIQDNITVNINVGYGENSGDAISPNISNGGPGATADGAGIDLTYTALRAALVNHNTSATDQTILNNLIMAASIGGETDFRIGNAQARALGLANATDATVDGAIGMGTGFTGDALIAGGLHEISHAMGRVANWLDVNWSVDLFRFDTATLGNATHTHVFGGILPPPNATSSYFSVDGGATRLADFGVASDPGDFLNGGVQGADAFNENVSGAPAGLTSVDLIFMDALGFQVSNQAPTITALTNTIGEDDPSYSRNLLSGASDFETDPISTKNLDTSVVTTGGRTLTSGFDYTLSGSTISLTGFGFDKFDSLAFNQTDTVIFHYNVVDSLNASTADTLTLTINGLNDPPVANSDVGSAGENQTKSFNVIANDTDADAGAVLSLVSLGTVLVSSANVLVNSINAASAFSINSNQIRFTPGTLFDHLALGQTATVTVNYTMQDDQAAQASSFLTLTVNGANDAPVITSDGGGNSAAINVAEHSTLVTTLTANDPDSGDTLTFSINDPLGMFELRNGNELHFVTAPDFENQRYQLTVQVSDGHGGTDTQTIFVNVTDVKEAITNGDAGGTLFGTSDNDLIDGQGGNDTIYAGDGNDTIIGGPGSDVVNAGEGNDIIVATIGDGSDVYNGGGGSDTIDMSGITAPVTMNLAQSTVSSSQTGQDSLSSIENAIGGSGNDVITGNGGDNRLDGSGGDDIINAGSGDDIVIGGAGNDTMNGEGGNDIFVFAAGFGNDKILQFDANPVGGQDHLDLTAFGITAANFAARVTITGVGADTLITIDGNAAQTIRLVGIEDPRSVTAEDFLLLT